MRKNYLLLLLLISMHSRSQVTQIFTDYNNFWMSSSTAINPVKPDLSHNLLAFRHNGTVFSTGVDNAKLAANGVSFTTTSFRALPINSVPIGSTGTSYYIGFGQLADGLNNAANNGPTIPFNAVTTGAQKAVFLTDGPQGMNLGTCLTNIPVTTGNLTFNLSASGITLSNIADGMPDILVSQVAQPTVTSDELYFVADDGVTIIGSKLVIFMNNNTAFPTVGNWMADFYNNNSTQTDANFLNTERTYKFFAADLSQFGINASNYMLAKKLIYKPGGNSDPAFIAYNEPSIGVAQRLLITSQPTTSNCDGTMPSNFTVRLTDAFPDGFVAQEGFVITASMFTGPGALLGTLTATTDATGTATFNNLYFEVGGDHVIQFSNSSLNNVMTTVISGPDCSDNIWTGNINTAWNNTGNWATAAIPNANNNVTIPMGRPNYPVLTANAGAKDLIMGAGATLKVNGKLFTIKGNIIADPTAYIQSAIDGSELYMSGNTLQTIPAGFIDGNVFNFTVENGAGVATNTEIKITGTLKVALGNFNTNGNVTMVCSFAPRKTGVIGRISGTISGEITTEQCFPARRAFRLISPSVTTSANIRANWQENATAWDHDPNPGYGTHITGIGASGSSPAVTDMVNGFDWQPSGSSSMFTFSNLSQTWSSAGNTVGTLNAGSPYRLMIRGSRSTNIMLNAAVPTDTKLRTKGTIRQGSVTVSGLSPASGHYNFVGNPYHAVVNMSTVMSASTNLTNFYYVWDPRVGGANPIVGVPGGRGAYVAVNTTTGVKSNASSNASIYLQPYQAFFVQTANLAAAPVLNFNETDKAVSTTQTNVFRSSINPHIAVSLYYADAFSQNETASDGLRIDFSADGNNVADVQDASKIANLDENISRLEAGHYLALESRSLPQANEELPLAVTQYRGSSYKMKLDVGNFEGLNVYLKDYFLNQQTVLTTNSENVIDFSVNSANSASTASNRFSIVFDESALSVSGLDAVDPMTIYPNPVSGNTIYVNMTDGHSYGEVSVHNLLGQVILKTSESFNSNNQLAIQLGSLPAGVYIIKVKTALGAAFSSKFIKE